MNFNPLKIKPQILTLFCLAAGAFLSLLIMFSCFFKIQSFIVLAPHYVITKFNTGLGYFLASASFYLIALKNKKNTGFVLSLFVLLLSTITIAEHFFHWNAGIDELMIKDDLTDPAKYPGRMTAGSAVHMFLLSLVLISIRFKKEYIINDILVIPLWASSFLVLIGYLYQAALNQFFPGYSNIAPVTVTTMFFITSAVFFNNSQDGIIAPFTKGTTAARVNRRILIVSIIATLLFAWLRMEGELRGLYLHSFGAVLMALFFILVLVYTTRTSTITLNRAEEETKKQKELSESIVESLPGIFLLLNENGEILRTNKQTEITTGLLNAELFKKSIQILFPEDQKKTMLVFFDEVKKQGVSTTEASLLNNAGNSVAFFFKAVPVLYENSNCIVVTGVDITERKSAEQEVHLANIQLRKLTKHIHNLRENERIHTAKEIHDELGQQLTVIKMNASLLKNKSIAQEEQDLRIDHVINLSEKTINSIRRIVYELRPQAIEDLGIIEVFKLHSKEFQSQTGIALNFFTEIETLNTSFSTSTTLFRIYQECLTNVARYAEATSVNASLDFQENELMLTVSDNGKGFDISDLKKIESLGVIGMRERAGMIGGHFSIHSEPGEGTHIHVTVDLSKELN